MSEKGRGHGNGQGEGHEMTEGQVPQTNLERLQTHLKEDSLAARLVSAQMGAATAAQQIIALKKVMSDRLNELRGTYAGTPNQDD